MNTTETNQTKKFHFQEINKIIIIQPKQQTTQYRQYTVQIKNANALNQTVPITELSEFLDSPEVENNYPHIVGYFRESNGEQCDFKPEYLEIRRICSVEEFWFFLNSQDI